MPNAYFEEETLRSLLTPHPRPEEARRRQIVATRRNVTPPKAAAGTERRDGKSPAKSAYGRKGQGPKKMTCH